MLAMTTTYSMPWQGLLAAEFWMDHVAGVLKMPTEQLREINMFHEGEETHFTQILEKCQVGLQTCRLIVKIYTALERCCVRDSRMTQTLWLAGSDQH